MCFCKKITYHRQIQNKELNCRHQKEQESFLQWIWLSHMDLENHWWHEGYDYWTNVYLLQIKSGIKFISISNRADNNSCTEAKNNTYVWFINLLTYTVIAKIIFYLVTLYSSIITEGRLSSLRRKVNSIDNAVTL